MGTVTEIENAPQWGDLLRDAVTKPGTVSDAYARFWRYSVGNQMLALWQCRMRGIEPGPIASFMHWKELGRHVKKGEKAITLCMPVTGKRTVKTTDETTGEETEATACYTRFVYKRNWFVLGQTEGAEFKPDPVPGWNRSAAFAKLDITEAPFTMLDGNYQGYASGRAVAISPVAEHPERTTFHEMAHIVLGHTVEGAMADTCDWTPRNIRELEAEAVAYIVGAALGLPGAEESRGYIQNWFHGYEVPEKSAHRIFHAADQILKAGIPEAAAARGRAASTA